jgi:hypothetical protein
VSASAAAAPPAAAAAVGGTPSAIAPPLSASAAFAAAAAAASFSVGTRRSCIVHGRPWRASSGPPSFALTDAQPFEDCTRSYKKTCLFFEFSL